MKKNQSTRPSPAIPPPAIAPQSVQWTGGVSTWRSEEELHSTVAQERLAQEKANLLKTLPESLELAGLAATLAGQQRIDTESAKGLARQALVLFEACREHLDTEAKRRAFANVARGERLDQYAGILKPKKFPASFKEFLRIIVRGKTETDRVKMFRDYLRDSIRMGKSFRTSDRNLANIPKTTLEEWNASLDHYRKKGFELMDWLHVAESFQRWRENRAAHTRTERAKTAANAKATSDLRKRTKSGDADAQYKLANRYLTGKGVAKDEKKADRLLKLAAAQGHKPAQKQLDGPS